MALSSPNLWIKTKINLHKSLLIAYFHTKLQTDGYFITCVESIRGPMNQHQNEVLEYKSNIWSSNILLSADIDLNTFLPIVLIKFQLKLIILIFVNLKHVSNVISLATFCVVLGYSLLCYSFTVIYNMDI